MESLNIYEPDKVIFCANEKDAFSSELVTKIQNEVLPFSLLEINEWGLEKDILNLEMKRDNDPLIYALPLIVPMVHRLDELKQPLEESKSNVRIPEIQQNNPFALCLAVQAGLVSKYNKRAYQEGFKAQTIDFENVSIKEYLSFVAEFENKFSPLNMTELYLRNSVTLRGANRPDGLNIVLVGENKTRDLCLFWNLRLAQNIFSNSILLILPFEALNKRRNLYELGESIKLAPWVHKKINIFSASVDTRKLKGFETRLRKVAGPSSKVLLVRKNYPVAYFHTKHAEETSEAEIEKKFFSFKSPRLEFSNLIKGGEWAVDIKFDAPYEYPAFSRINHYLCGSPKEMFYSFHNGYWIRSAYEKFVHRVNSKSNFLKGYLINDDQAYQEFFRDKGYNIRLTEKHSYTEGFLKLIQNPEILADSQIINLFWMLQKKDAYTYENLCAELKKGDNGGEIVDDLVSKHILLRGMKFRCGSCGLSRFYPINTLDEEMQCPGCLRNIQPPSKASIMFRLNELAIQAVEQGSIPVALTHRFFRKISINQTLRLFGAEISNDSLKIDVDYITTYHGSLVLVECKDFKSGVLPKEKKNAMQQLSNLVALAKRVDALIVVLSTLLPHPSPEYDDIVRQIQKMRDNTKISIHLLSLSKNGIINLKQPEKIVEHPFLFE